MASDEARVKAARLHRHGEPLAVEAVELPAPGDDEVRVELEFGGVNPVDRYAAEGRMAPDGPLPRTLGGEAAGYLDGRPVLVAGEGLGSQRDGVWATAAIVPTFAVVELPDGVDLQGAAAMGIAGLTAWNVVRDLARVTAEDRVLVLGASGGVGSMIVSLARSLGATVWGQTGSQEKTQLIEAQGAEQAVVAGPDQLREALGDFEPTVAFDPLGDGFVQPVLESVAPRARLVSFGTSAGPEVTFSMQMLYRKGVSFLGSGGLRLRREERRAGLHEALRALGEGRIRVRIDDVLALERVNEAFERLAERKVSGKLLLALAS